MNSFSISSKNFGRSNAVGAFLRVVSQMIIEDGLVLVGSYSYFDDVTAAADSIEELNERSLKFVVVLKKLNMTLNENITIKGVERIKVFGFEIE